MPNFATVNDVELVLQAEITGDAKVAAAEFALLTASAGIRNYCRQYISYVEDDEIVLDTTFNGRHLFLPELPVISVSAVIENSVELVVTTDYEPMLRRGILSRVRRPWYLGGQVIAVTYTHGYEVIPDDIVAVTARAASRLYQAGLRSAETEGVPGVISKTLGDFSVTFGADSPSEGAMGVSGARVLLLSEKDILNRYRI